MQTPCHEKNDGGKHVQAHGASRFEMKCHDVAAAIYQKDSRKSLLD
jgi:hypothetical protein